MIDAVYGKVEKTFENTIVIHSGFIDFELQVSAVSSRYYASLAGDERNDCKVYTYLQHREDAMVLYGFKDVDERNLFLEVIKVQGIGPKQALKILSSITPADFIAALDTGNLTVLTSIPGLGTKTAQKMMLALRDKLALQEQQTRSVSLAGNEKFTRQIISDIVHSLSDMGYDKREVRNAVEQGITELDQDNSDAQELEKKLFTIALIKLG
jgi:holliday junction DNA helicase RuvA